MGIFLPYTILYNSLKCDCLKRRHSNIKDVSVLPLLKQPSFTMYIQSALIPVNSPESGIRVPPVCRDLTSLLLLLLAILYFILFWFGFVCV